LWKIRELLDANRVINLKVYNNKMKLNPSPWRRVNLLEVCDGRKRKRHYSTWSERGRVSERRARESE